MSDNIESRRAPRVRVAALASLATGGVLSAGNQALCSVRDLSRAGIGLETGQPPMPGQIVTLRLALDDRVHELRTLATRVSRRGKSNFYEIGLDWSGCPAEQLAFLDEVLKAVEVKVH